MNHVSGPTLAALDALGEALLVGDSMTVDERLRSDFRVTVECDKTALDSRTAPIRFCLEASTPAETLREHGPFVGTVVDGVERRLCAWGLDPPARYTHAGTDDGWQVYTGVLGLP
jgi:hypothetical protein